MIPETETKETIVQDKQDIKERKKEKRALEASRRSSQSRMKVEAKVWLEKFGWRSFSAVSVKYVLCSRKYNTVMMVVVV